MDIITEAHFVEEPVTDLDIAFRGGVVINDTLVDGKDSYIEKPCCIVISYSNGETVTHLKRHMLGFTVRKRLHRRKVTPPVPPETVSPEDPSGSTASVSAPPPVDTPSTRT